MSEKTRQRLLRRAKARAKAKAEREKRRTEWPYTLKDYASPAHRELSEAQERLRLQAMQNSKAAAYCPQPANRSIFGGVFGFYAPY